MAELLVYRPANFAPLRVVEYVGLTADSRVIVRETGRNLCGVFIINAEQVVERVTPPPTTGETNGRAG